MLLVRGGIAFLVGVVVSNQPGASADALMTLFGLWAVAEGAATIRQAYARVDSRIASRLAPSCSCWEAWPWWRESWPSWVWASPAPP